MQLFVVLFFQSLLFAGFLFVRGVLLSVFHLHCFEIADYHFSEQLAVCTFSCSVSVFTFSCSCLLVLFLYIAVCSSLSFACGAFQGPFRRARLPLGAVLHVGIHILFEGNDFRCDVSSRLIVNELWCEAFHFFFQFFQFVLTSFFQLGVAILQSFNFRFVSISVSVLSDFDSQFVLV